MDLGKKRKDYRYEIKHSLQIKEGINSKEGRYLGYSHGRYCLLHLKPLNYNIPTVNLYVVKISC